MSKLKRIFTAAVIATLPSSAMAADQTANTACQLVSYASLDMRTLEDGRVTVPIKLKNRDVYFLIDTGGVVSTIQSGVANALKLSRSSSSNSLIGVGGVRDMKETVQVDDFSIGLLHGKDMKFFVDPNNVHDWDGILAPNLLRNFDLDFDFAGDKLNLISRNPCPGSGAYWTKDSFAVVSMKVGGDGHIFVPLTVDGTKLWAILDTGARDTFLPMSIARTLHAAPGDSRMKQSPVAINGARAYTFPFQSINFEGIAVHNPRIAIVNDVDMHGVNTMILGIGILRQLHMFISYKEEKIYLTPATAH